ncbi:MAG: hypothetical protein NC409_10860, partial [Clostridium sp.]|nr:hypothetical protein [Clostridium sp.]
RAAGAECGGCGKAGTAYGHKNTTESYVLNLSKAANSVSKHCDAQKDTFIHENVLLHLRLFKFFYF